MNGAKLAVIGTLATLLLPAINRKDVESELRSIPPTSRVQEPNPQDPQKAVDELKLKLAEANRQIGISERDRAALQEERTKLVETQEAFRRMRNLGSPMQYEANLRNPVEARIAAQEHQLSVPAPEEQIAIYRANINSVFSRVNYERDGEELKTMLKSLGVNSDQERTGIEARFVDEMKKWGTSLQRPVAIQRLIASRGTNVAVDALPTESARFCAPPCDDNLLALAAVAAEYAAAKTMFLQGVIRDLKLK